jgi:membrane-associated phospholipid phosphatase
MAAIKIFAFQLLLLGLNILPAVGQENFAKEKKPLFKKEAVKILAVPTVLMGAGLLTIGDRPYFSSHDTYTYFQKNYPNTRTRADDVTWIMPAVAVYGLNFGGIKGKHNFIDRSILFGLSTGLANTVSLSLKHGVGYQRPDGKEFNSFPSGHTTNAFVCAEFMHQEYKHLSPWYSVAAYTTAAATGALRMVNNRHWMSDVLFGAGLGMASTKLIYYAYPHLKRIVFKGNNEGYSVMAMPVYDRARGIGLVAVARF